MGWGDVAGRRRDLQLLVALLRVEADRLDGGHHHGHAQRDGNKQHDDVLGAVLQRQLLIVRLLLLLLRAGAARTARAGPPDWPCLDHQKWDVSISPQAVGHTGRVESSPVWAEGWRRCPGPHLERRLEPLGSQREPEPTSRCTSRRRCLRRSWWRLLNEMKTPAQMVCRNHKLGRENSRNQNRRVQELSVRMRTSLC